MENYAYNYSLQQYCITPRARAKISMSELFDMVSGTSTGSLLTTAVVMPDANGQPKYYADNGSIIY